MACKMPKLITSARGPIALWLGVGAAEPPTVAELQLQLKQAAKKHPRHAELSADEALFV